MVEPAPSQGTSGLRRLFYGPSELRAGWRLLIFLAIVVSLTSIANQALDRLFRGAGEATRFLVLEVEDITIILFASWIMGRIERRTVGDYGLPWQRTFRREFWQGAGLGLAFITVLILALRAAGLLHLAGVALHGADVWKWAALYGFAFILVALREEFRSRGYALYTLTSGIGFWPAAILSSAFFGFTHRGNSGEDWIGLFDVGLFGMLACFLVRRTGSLWMPIGLHMAFDWGETYLYGVADSGHVLPGHLLNSAPTGPAWLSGGTVGPEGSVLCTLMIILLWGVCAMWLRAAKYPNFTIVGGKSAAELSQTTV
jgi:uncharacterized protein